MYYVTIDQSYHEVIWEARSILEVVLAGSHPTARMCVEERDIAHVIIIEVLERRQQIAFFSGEEALHTSRVVGHLDDLQPIA